MIHYRNLLADRVRAAMDNVGIDADAPALVTQSTRPEFGDYQVNAAMPAAKRLGEKPRDVARRIIDCMEIDDIAERVEIAGPGFINVHLRAAELAAQAASIAAQGVQLEADEAERQRVVVDYSGPNLAKEMHVGHLRSTIIGDAVVRSLEFAGHEVIRQNHMGDWGTQFGMLIAELEEQLGEGQAADWALEDLEAFYQQAKRHFDADAGFADKARDYVVRLQSGDAHCLDLWRRFIEVSVAHSEEIYSKLNVTLTHADIRAESAYNAELAGVVERLVEQGIAVEDQGAIVVFLHELADKDGNPSPAIVRKSDGGYLYATSDLAALNYRSETLNADRILYFVDARQALHLKQVFMIARRAGFVRQDVSLEHLAFGTMMGSDGKPFKTRTGGTVKLADLLAEAVTRAEALVGEKAPDLDDAERAEVARKVGIGAIKYADLSKNRTSDYIFNWDTMLSFEGNTAPYLQYAYTRIQSVFRKSGDFSVDAGAMLISEPAERRLALRLVQFPEALEQVVIDCNPHLLCAYLYALASDFMSFYEHCPILKEGVSRQEKCSRLALSKATASTLATGLELLGIEVMERM